MDSLRKGDRGSSQRLAATGRGAGVTVPNPPARLHAPGCGMPAAHRLRTGVLLEGE